MPIKIHKGTVRHDGPSLCDSCRHATIIKGSSLSQKYIVCSQLGERGVQYLNSFEKITSCTEYSDKARTTLAEMKSVAWVLVTDRRREKIGFKTPKEWREQRQKERTNPSIEIEYEP